MTTYAELRLQIDRGVGRGSYRVVATGPAGEAIGRFKLPFSSMEIENFILKVGSTRRGRRRIESPEMELAKGFGTRLFEALFEGEVRELYRSSLSETRSAGQGLRVTLSMTRAPELLQIPWEYLYDRPSFLSISTWTPIVRYLDLPKPRRPLRVALPIRILALVSAPVDADAIDAPRERTKLEAALAPLIGMGVIAIDWLEEASLLALQRRLRKQDYHVFHFIGHGGYDPNADDGVLLFEDEQARGRQVSGVQLGTILADAVSLRLAVLNSCEGARSSLQDPFSGVATSLIEREIPAVVGMQFEITDRAAIVFASEFYAALADGLPVDSSVAEARKAIYADQNDIEWGTPVLFMRVSDGRLFDVESITRVGPDAAVETERIAPAERARAAAAEAERIEAEHVELARLEKHAAERAERERTAAMAAPEAERLDDERLERPPVRAAEPMSAGTAVSAGDLVQPEGASNSPASKRTVRGTRTRASRAPSSVAVHPGAIDEQLRVDADQGAVAPPPAAAPTPATGLPSRPTDSPAMAEWRSMMWTHIRQLGFSPGQSLRVWYNAAKLGTRFADEKNNVSFERLLDDGEWRVWESFPVRGTGLWIVGPDAHEEVLASVTFITEHPEGHSPAWEAMVNSLPPHLQRAYMAAFKAGRSGQLW